MHIYIYMYIYIYMCVCVYVYYTQSIGEILSFDTTLSFISFDKLQVS